MTTRIGAREARNNFATILGRVHFGKETIILERSGKLMAAMIPIEMYEQIIAEREARFQVLQRIREKLPDVSAEEVTDDVADAIHAVRNAHGDQHLLAWGHLSGQREAET